MKTVILLLIFAILISGCVQQPPAEKETVKIGVIEPLTGVRAEAGQYVKNGLELALNEINNDTSRKYNIILIYEDGQYDPRITVTAFQKLKDADGVNFVIGEHGSSPTLAIAPLAEESKTILITPSAQAPEISKAGDYIFRTSFSSEQEVPFFSGKLHDIIGNTTINLAYINTDYGIAYSALFKADFEKLGGSVGFMEKFDTKEVDFRSILLKMSGQNHSNILFIGTGRNVGTAMKQASEIGLNITWFTVAASEGQEFLTTAGGLAEGVIYPYPYDAESTDTAMKSFREKYLTAYGHVNEMYSANAYDTLYLLSNCFEKAGTEVDAVKQCLYDTKDYKGASGTLTFDKNGDVQKPFIMKTVINGSFVKYKG